MATLVLILLAGLQIKHFAADYLLQTNWMLAGKCSPAHPGGYAHVGVHAIGSLIVLLLAGVPLALTMMLVVAEAVLHYLIDMSKARWSRTHSSDMQSRAFWAAMGADQLMHQLTYAAMIFIVLHAVRSA